MTTPSESQTGLGRELFSKLTPIPAISILVLLGIVFISLTAPWLTPYSESQILGNESYAPADETYLLGGDVRGRDLFTRLFFGMRMTFVLSIASASLCFVFGCAVGFASAFSGGLLDAVLGRIFDGLMAFPSIIFSFVLIVIMGPSVVVVVIAAAFVFGVQVYRVARALGKDIVVQDYMEVARLRKEKLSWIILQEILPNAIPPLAAEFGVRVTFSILLISALSFLGLGVQPPQADLGVMIRENMGGLVYGSFAPLYPAIGIAVFVLAVNFLIDWYVKVMDINLPTEG